MIFFYNYYRDSTQANILTSLQVLCTGIAVIVLVKQFKYFKKVHGSLKIITQPESFKKVGHNQEGFRNTAAFLYGPL